MPLTISDPETERLARELAARTGETVENAVTRALREHLQRAQEQEDERARIIEDLMEIGKRCSQLPVFDDRSPEEIIEYGEYGEPV